MKTKGNYISCISIFGLFIFVFFMTSCAAERKNNNSTSEKSSEKIKKTDETILRSKLAQVGVTIQCRDDGSILILEGFPYQKDFSGDYIIRIVEVKNGIFTASGSSTVPTAMMGMVYGVSGGSFMAQCNVEDGTQTLADAVGNKWVFAEPGMSFNVYLPGSLKPTYTLKTKVKEAMISFSKEGVLVKGFEFIVIPGGSGTDQKAK
ncbi:MAG: hypothetical protein AB7D05_05980 [Mangrovibacterium sp.]